MFTLIIPKLQDVNIYADNGLGKTTIYDSFLWLLFDKDSQGKKDFEIKTRVKTGEVVPMLDHEVMGTFDINGGTEVTLKKVYREKYTKKRGSASSVFDGHETDYFIDGVPKSKGEYQRFIEEIAPEKLFRLLTSPTHFNEGMTWQERRQILLDVCGNVTDMDVIAADPELQELSGLKRSVDDEKKVVMSERKKINDELLMIPARIDEAMKALPGDIGGSASSLVKTAKRLSGVVTSLQVDKSTIENGGQRAVKRKELAEVEGAILELKNKHTALAACAGKDDREQLTALRRQLAECNSVSINEMAAFKRIEESIDRLTLENREIVKEWKDASAKPFVPGGACPTCGQEYPEELLSAQEADFNRAKAKKIEGINADGARNAAAIKSAKESLEARKNEFLVAEGNVAVLTGRIADIEKVIASKEQGPDVTDLPEYQELHSQAEAIRAYLDDDSVFGGDVLAEIEEKIAEAQKQIGETNQQITAIDMRANGERRIEELKQQEQELARQFEQHEKMLFILEKFTRAKVSMLDEQINGKFSLVRWKLFEDLINGALSETCVCTIDGVPYPSLNSAGKIKAGLDIIKTLSAHHRFSPVVFVDNAESVVSLPGMNCQLIRLVVSGEDKKLRVELQ